MSVATPLPFTLENTFADELEGLYVSWQGEPAPRPSLLLLNDELALEMGIEPAALRTPEALAVLSGSAAPDGATPIAQAYAGHQFGGYSPQLGDGRALLLGEIVDAEGTRRDIQLKGSGRTPYARGGDGKAAVGPMLREYVIGEAMHALGIPTTRALAVVATGEKIARETMLPGAVLTRVAASHLRVGTFQYASAHPGKTLIQPLADYAIARHYPDAAAADEPYLAFFTAVVESQAALIAQWMLVGFVHGVMNTDNMAISGETIDYGPCAFIDAFDPSAVFSSIDHGGRYAYGSQPQAARWNLARLAEPLLPLLHPESETAVAMASAVLDSYPGRFGSHWNSGMRVKLGLLDQRPGDDDLVRDLLELIRVDGADYTSTLRALSSAASGEAELAASFHTWTARWRDRLVAEGREMSAVTAGMDAVNPLYIPRNHIVEAALTAATGGDLDQVVELLEVLAQPYVQRPGLDRYAEPGPASDQYVTYCGT